MVCWYRGRFCPFKSLFARTAGKTGRSGYRWNRRIRQSLSRFGVGLGCIALVISVSWGVGVLPAIAAERPTQPPLELTNQFVVQATDAAAFLDRWQQIRTYMVQQPGFMTAELRQTALQPDQWTMTEEWRSLQDYRRAVSQPEFQALVVDFPATATWFAPDLFPTAATPD